MDQFQGVPGPSQDDFNTLSDQIAPSGYSTTGLTATNATISAGGFAKIGKLVVVNIRLNVTTQISAGTVFLTGLPKYTNITTNTVISLQNNRNLDISMTDTGAIAISNNPIPTGTLIINGVYIAD